MKNKTPISIKLFNTLVKANLIENINKNSKITHVYELNKIPDFSSKELPFSIDGEETICKINIAELAYICKIWVNTLNSNQTFQCFSIKSSEDWSSGFTIGTAFVLNQYEETIYTTPFCESEYEATLLATEWILENEIDETIWTFKDVTLENILDNLKIKNKIKLDTVIHDMFFKDKTKPTDIAFILGISINEVFLYIDTFQELGTNSSEKKSLNTFPTKQQKNAYILPQDNPLLDSYFGIGNQKRNKNKRKFFNNK